MALSTWHVAHGVKANGFLREVFQCQADDRHHAIDQTKDAYPRCKIYSAYQLAEQSSMRPIKKDTIVFWTDPDEGACSQYAVVVDYQGDGIYSCKTAKGGELEATHAELTKVHLREAQVIRAAMLCYEYLSPRRDVTDSEREMCILRLHAAL